VKRITVNGVSMRFKVKEGELVALDGLQLSVEAAQFVALIGLSGCGKSTLLKLVAGLLKPSSGEIRIADEVVRGPRTDVGMMFQTPVLLPWKSVLDNVMVQAVVRRLPHKEYDARARALLKQVGLAGYENSYVFQLSGGMQQRVAFCRAVLHHPTVLLMDEPFGALDALTREQMAFDLQRMWSSQQAQTVLFVTHSIPEAVLLADRVAVFSPRPGRIIDVVDVPLPRPRTPEVMSEKEFSRLTARLRSMVFAHDGSGRDAAAASAVAALSDHL
jgi:NitT/TauT family transport system ATP-binding protein